MPSGHPCRPRLAVTVGGLHAPALHREHEARPEAACEHLPAALRGRLHWSRAPLYTLTREVIASMWRLKSSMTAGLHQNASKLVSPAQYIYCARARPHW